MPIKFGTWSSVDGKWVNTKDGAGELRLFKWEAALFRRIKSRSAHKCWVCDKQIPKGCYTYGDRYYSRLCINCFESFVENFMKSMDNHKYGAKEVLEQFKKEKGMMIKHNVINSL